MRKATKVGADPLIGLDLRASMGRVVLRQRGRGKLVRDAETEISQRIWDTHEETHAAVFAFIQRYDRHRRHSTSGDQTPKEVDQHYRQEQPLAP